MQSFGRSPGLLCTIIPEVDVSFAIWSTALWPSSPVDTRRPTIRAGRKDVTSRNGYRCKRVSATKVSESDDDTSRWTTVDRSSSRQRHLSATVARRTGRSERRVSAIVERRAVILRTLLLLLLLLLMVSA